MTRSGTSLTCEHEDLVGFIQRAFLYKESNEASWDSGWEKSRSSVQGKVGVLSIATQDASSQDTL